MMIDIDDMGTHFAGYAYAQDSNKALPSTFAAVVTSGKEHKFRGPAALMPVNPVTNLPVPWSEIEKMYPGVVAPTTADLELHWDEETLSVTWNTNIGTYGAGRLAKSAADKPSEYHPIEIRTWESFKEWALTLEPYRYLFRGQDNAQNRLRTSFHRNGRADLFRFMNEDVQTLGSIMSGKTKHFFDLRDPFQNAAFLGLVQHHGYPTPLLDWTESPFIGAFFAYRPIRSPFDQAKNRMVRIFIFDSKEWRKDFNQVQMLASVSPHFSLMRPLAIENLRLVPQQGVSSVTNVDDIETYIGEREREKEKKYLQVIELPANIRSIVMRELSVMGITAGSMLPGLDGSCEELRERFFPVV